MARPRAFEPDKALEDIKDVFWRFGYEGASMQEIEAATGLKKQSLYRLYGDKRGMYLEAIDHYARNEIAETADQLSWQGEARDRFKRLFRNVIDAAASGEDRRGCFLCNASVDQAPVNEATQKLVAELMDIVKKTFAEALTVSAPYDKDAKARDAKAAQLLGFYMGLRVMIRAGLPIATLKAAAAETVASI